MDFGKPQRGWRRASESTYEITFFYEGKRRRERLQLEPSVDNDENVAQIRAIVVAAINAGKFDYATQFPDSTYAQRLPPPECKTVHDFLSEWLEEAGRVYYSSTFADYRKTINSQLIPAFGKLAITDLNLERIEAWLSDLTCTRKRILNILSVLRIALRAAVKKKLIASNPLSDFAFERKEPPRKDHTDPFTKEEQTAILDQISGQGANMIKFAFWTGLRTSEICAIHWSDVDWVHETIHVWRAKTQHATEYERPKTASSKRFVTLLPPALEALTAQKAFTFLAGEDGVIFLNPRTNHPWPGDQAIRKTLWQHALKRAGVRYRNPYQCRHTFASMMLSAGESPAWVAKQLGHRDLSMVTRVYGRWIPGSDPEAGLRAVAMFHIKDLKSNRIDTKK